MLDISSDLIDIDISSNIDVEVNVDFSTCSHSEPLDSVLISVKEDVFDTGFYQLE